MKRSSAYTLCLATFLVLHGHIAAAAQGAAFAPANAKPVNVKIGVLLHGSSIPIIVAYKREYFRLHGIEANLQTVSPQDQMPALLRRDVDAISPSSFPVILSTAQQNPGKLRCYLTGGESIRGDSIYGLVVPAMSPYKSLADLIGHTIASGSKFTSVNLRFVLRQRFHDTKDATRIRDFNDRTLLLQAVQRHEVEAAVVDQPTLAAVLKDPQLRVIDVNFRARYLSEPYWSGAGVLSAAWVQQNPAAAVAFLSAIEDAIKWTNEHPAAARQIFVHHFDLRDVPARSVGMYKYPGARFRPPAPFLKSLENMLRDAGMLTPAPVDSQLFVLPERRR